MIFDECSHVAIRNKFEEVHLVEGPQFARLLGLPRDDLPWFHRKAVELISVGFDTRRFLLILYLGQMMTDVTSSRSVANADLKGRNRCMKGPPRCGVEVETRERFSRLQASRRKSR